jgi:hypothetical protein
MSVIEDEAGFQFVEPRRFGEGYCFIALFSDRLFDQTA